MSSKHDNRSIPSMPPRRRAVKFGVARSTVSRHIVEATAKKLQEFKERDLSATVPFAIMLALWAWLVRWTCRLVFSELDARAAARATMELRGSGGAGDAGSRRMV